MSPMDATKKLSLEQIKDAARTLVSTGQNVRARLHQLTVDALAQGQLAKQEIGQVLDAITEGVSLGAAERKEEVRAAMSNAVHGIDDALANVAEAMHLALDEASSHAKDFAEQDLKQRLEELQHLEQLFQETISRVTDSASGLVKQEFQILTEHARRAGTSTGSQVKAVAEELANRLRATAHSAGGAGKQAAREVGIRVATIASDKLADIAARIQHKADALKQKNSAT